MWLIPPPLVFLALWLGLGFHWLPALALAYLSLEVFSIVMTTVAGVRSLRGPD